MSGIQIIGGGLYGCLTAYHIAKSRPDLRIDIIEAGDHLLTAFDSITVGDTKFNNGFHGLELPRSQPLFDFIISELGTEMKEIPNQRGLSVMGHLIPYESDLKSWPEEIKGEFTAPPGEYQGSSPINSLVSERYADFFAKVGVRYSETTADIEHRLFPWFFPADFSITSSDEGDLFRNEVRSGDLVASYGMPNGELFEAFQSDMESLLRRMGVNIHFSTKVNFSSTGITYESDEVVYDPQGSPVYFCASLAIILKDVFPESFADLIDNKRCLHNVIMSSSSDPTHGYSEILVANERFPWLSRLSFPDRDLNGERLIQCEMLTKSDVDAAELKDGLAECLNEVLGLSGESSVRYVDSRLTRRLFYPASGVQPHAVGLLENWVTTNLPNFHMRKSFAPINMAKTWLYAEENASRID
ncbi:MAG: NAD(P)-binding protein [Verrucomicrobiales bacterium]|nr:NAD(P)-binding protein [Verrucomicrobiales bacterium]